MTFGKSICEYRKKAGLSQREVASRVFKEDGNSISPQYLNDIERDRRNPPSDFMIEQLASLLGAPIEVLYYQAGEIPKDERNIEADEETVVEAWTAFRKVLRSNEQH